MAKYLLDTNICIFFLRGKEQIARKISEIDIFIGATAIANHMILVTDNEKHLNRLSNIDIENWIIR